MIYLSSSHEDSLSELLTEENIGITFNPDDLNPLLEWLVNKEKFKALSYDNFDIAPYEIRNISKKVEDLLK